MNEDKKLFKPIAILPLGLVDLTLVHAWQARRYVRLLLKSRMRCRLGDVLCFNYDHAGRSGILKQASLVMPPLFAMRGPLTKH